MAKIIDAMVTLILRAIYAISPKHSKPRDISFSHLVDVDKITYFVNLPDNQVFTSLEEFVEYHNREPIKKEITDPDKLNLLTQFVKECSSSWIHYYYVTPALSQLVISFYSHDSLIETLDLTGSNFCFRSTKGQLFRHLERDQLNSFLEIFDLTPSDLGLN